MGGVPLGRSGGQVGVDALLEAGPPLPVGRRQAPPSKRVPPGQQLGGVPFGRSGGHAGVDVLLEAGPPVPAEVLLNLRQKRPFQCSPGLQRHTPPIRTMPREQVTGGEFARNDCEHAGGFWTFWVSTPESLPPGL